MSSLRRVPLAVVLLGCFAPAAGANVFPVETSRRGPPAFDVLPRGPLPLVHEDLTVDARHLPDDGLVTLTAEYTVENDSAESSEVDLVFLTPGVLRLRATLDGEPLQSRGSITRREVIEDERFDGLWPDEWSTPSFGEERLALEGASDLPQSERFGRFAASVTPGRHRLAFAFDLRPARTSDLSRVRSHGLGVYALHQVVYLLAPATRWGTTPSLHVRLLLPPDWEARSDPPLDPGDTLREATFAGIPSDTLSLVMRHVPPSETARQVVEAMPWVILPLLVLLLVAGCIVHGRQAYRRGVGPIRTVLVAMLFGYLFLYPAGMALWSSPALVYDGSQTYLSRSLGWGLLAGFLTGASPVGVGVVLLAASISGVTYSRQQKRNAPVPRREDGHG